MLIVALVWIGVAFFFGRKWMRLWINRESVPLALRMVGAPVVVVAAFVVPPLALWLAFTLVILGGGALFGLAVQFF